MAQSKSNGKGTAGKKKPAQQKNGGAGSGTKKNNTAANKTSAKNSAAEKLDSVRGGSQSRAQNGTQSKSQSGARKDSTRAKEAAAKAAGREKAKAAENKKSAPKASDGAKKSSAPAAKKPSQTKKSAPAKKKLSAADARLWQRMLIIAVAVLAGVVGVIQMVTCANSQVGYRQTVMVTLSDDIETTGVAIRNERIITSEKQGVIVSTIDNGGKVSKGETVASVYRSTDEARDYMRMAELEDMLEQFRSMETAGEDNATEVTALQKAIRGELLDLSGFIYDGDASDAVRVSDELLYLLNKAQVATRVVDNFSDKAAKLENELNALKAQYPEEPGHLKSPLSGYYISTADGYENLLNTGICQSLTPEKLDEILAIREEPDNSSVVGKIADDYIWYMACEVSAEDADRLAKNYNGEYVWKDYTLYLAYSELDSITAKLVSVNTGADISRRVLIFECSYMVSELSTIRIQPVTIELSSYSGLEINSDSITTREGTVKSSELRDWDMEGRTALAKEIYPLMFAENAVSGSDTLQVDENNPYAVAADRLVNRPGEKLENILKDIQLPDEITFEQQGVYIAWGNEIIFRRIKPIYQEGEKVLCAYNLGDNCLKMYDKVVDKPEEVYHGQIVNNIG